MLAGAPFAHEIDFGTGLPTGAVVYSVLGNDNQPMAGYENLTVTPLSGAMSITLLVPPAANTVATELFESRVLTWAYMTPGGLVTGRTRYRVEKDIPFAVSCDGVRAKLGVESYELDDRDINLLIAYATIGGSTDLSVYENTGGLAALTVINAIEAQAALDVLPSLQLAVAKSEDSGTNKYQRFNAIDWASLADSLGQWIIRLENLEPVDQTPFLGIIFTTAGRTTDPVTNAGYL